MHEVIPLYPLAPVVFVGAGALFLLRMARHLRVFAGSGPATVSDHAEARFLALFRYAIVQVRMFADPAAGLMHAAIFWGFVILSLGTLDRVAFGLVNTIVAAPFDGWLWRLLLAVQNLVVVSVLAAVGVALFRRIVVRPRRLTLSRDGLVILLLIGGVVLTELLSETFRIAWRGDPDAAWAFAANALAVPAARLAAEAGEAGAKALGTAYSGAFWANVLLVSFFLAYLPRSKHLHIVTAFFNAAFRKLAPRGELPPVDLETESATFGVKTIADLSWKDLLDGFTCTECGRCQDACPAWATGKPLNPKTLIMGLREMSVEAEAGMPLIPFIRPSGGPSAEGSERAKAGPIAPW